LRVELKGDAMTEWMAIEKWSDCKHMIRPGWVFEIQNAAGQTLFADCGSVLTVPFDWSSAPIRFRAVPQPPPVRSAPIPPPAIRR
jgi:hypothetical protein